jgi:hypothetical protein
MRGPGGGAAAEPDSDGEHAEAARVGRRRGARAPHAPAPTRKRGARQVRGGADATITRAQECKHSSKAGFIPTPADKRTPALSTRRQSPQYPRYSEVVPSGLRMTMCVAPIGGTAAVACCFGRPF